MLLVLCPCPLEPPRVIFRQILCLLDGSHVSLRMICAHGSMLDLCKEPASSARELIPQNGEEWELVLTYASFPSPWWDHAKVCSVHPVDCWIGPQMPHSGNVLMCTHCWLYSFLLPPSASWGHPHWETCSFSKVQPSMTTSRKPPWPLQKN